MTFTESQFTAITTTERICSSISLIGTTFIIGSFLYDKAFRKPINRLVFYASFGNVMSNVATLISRNGIQAGLSSPLCQFQAFLIQMFMPADAMWMLCLSINVYLSFFRKYDADKLKSLEWRYLLFCYGIPLIPAFVYFFVNVSPRGKVYGSATLWCWISIKWDFLRIAVFYGPVWFIIAIIVSIYTYVGVHIFRKRRELRAFSHTPAELTNPVISNFTMSKMTEVEVKSEIAYPMKRKSEIASSNGENGKKYAWDDDAENILPPEMFGHTVNIESAAHMGSRNASRPDAKTSQLHPQRTTTQDAHGAAWSYTRCAMLFFVALLVTWVPSTANRVYSLVHPDRVNFPLNYVSALVLPLQGFWNFCVYVTISRPAVRNLIRHVRGRLTRHRNVTNAWPLQDRKMSGSSQTNSNPVSRGRAGSMPKGDRTSVVATTPLPSSSFGRDQSRESDGDAGNFGSVGGISRISESSASERALVGFERPF